ncbi:hypothetical protein AAEU31_15160 [Pseudoalteromonas sp. SSMSWG5]|jgi:hypothetical protein|uniref:hypothetical protein n=1 Tax=Pseudoalteromonas TaxID=53246 RepID=UPI000C408231|nr:MULTISPECIES: hypothetical protein [unclassified Pseudoalteromonas]MBD57608.1 hypothetical protein [Pseudoalteromonas sp.]MBU76874.1 hypothetical protein [Pseudoalteromonadaceae bacterium]MCF2901789.1 hypothetical protein [Pseudoalteromonas sp. OFAV1]MCF2920606.1 hypothetical protein [Pseudoalteromonas sp. APAL1]MCO7250301.1 hypothetical protein [Pseudoalteromonas sp. Ps84H-4]|tara:strand:- start:1878 stop:2120 length:243 start_codon:yes stop_codon:yes gene_type:complete
MIYFLPTLAIFGVVALLYFVHSKKECTGLCVSFAVTGIALLLTMTMMLAGLGALRSSLMFAATIFIIYQLLGLVRPIKID